MKSGAESGEIGEASPSPQGLTNDGEAGVQSAGGETPPVDKKEKGKKEKKRKKRKRQQRPKAAA